MDPVPVGLVRGQGQPSVLRICWWSPSFFRRGLLLVLLFAGELTVLSLWLDTASLSQSTGLLGIVGDWGAWILRAILGFVAIFGTFAWLKHKAAIEKIFS